MQHVSYTPGIKNNCFINNLWEKLPPISISLDYIYEIWKYKELKGKGAVGMEIKVNSTVNLQFISYSTVLKQFFINIRHTYKLIAMPCHFSKLCNLNQNSDSAVIVHAELIMLLTLAEHNGIVNLLILLPGPDK